MDTTSKMNNQSGSLHFENSAQSSSDGTHYLNGNSANDAGEASITWGQQANFKASAASTTKRIILPLRSCIKHALKSVPVDRYQSKPFLSTSYLQSCLKVAISLTDQILQAEKLAAYGISRHCTPPLR
jgi:hypothetical protein